jgi:nitroreductase
MENKTIEKLNWRYATKAFDTNKKLSNEQVHMLKESLRLAPSSVGMQPWKFIEVKDPEVREKIKELGWGQAQFTDASNLFILCAKTDLGELHIDTHIHKTAKTHGVEVAHLSGYKSMMMNTIEHLTPEQRIGWSERQLYIAMGMLLTTAAMNDIDACPMEGFDRNAVDDLLGLREKGITAVGMCAVGFRKEDDAAAKRPKVRFDEEEVFITI